MHDGTLNELACKGIEIHARSVFLQGLLLMPPETIPQYFKQWETHLKAWHNACFEASIKPQHAALAWACGIQEISSVIVGIETVKQLRDLLELSLDIPLRFSKQLTCNDEKLLNPSLWEL